MKHIKDIHIVYIITHLELGGAQKVCLSLFNGIVKNKSYSSSLITGNHGYFLEKLPKKSNILIIKYMERNVGIRSCINEFLSFITIIKQLRTLKKEHPHIAVHTHCSKAGILGRWAAFFAGISTRIHTIHGFAFHQHQNRIVWFFMYLIELITSMITTHFICVSSVDVKTAIQLFPGFSKKHSIIRAAVNWKTFYQPARITPPFPVTNEPFVFGTVASLKRGKNLFDILQAFKEAHHYYPHTCLEIIGGGVLHTAIKTWIMHHNLHHVVTLHGWQEHVAPFMMSWHAFVFSSLWEGLPCAIVEARLLKLPVLSYDTGGIRDVIIHKKNGMLYQQKDWKGLAQGMIQLITDKTLYTKLQNYSEQLDDFNDQYMIRQHHTLYHDLL